MGHGWGAIQIVVEQQHQEIAGIKGRHELCIVCGGLIGEQETGFSFIVGKDVNQSCRWKS